MAVATVSCFEASAESERTSVSLTRGCRCALATNGRPCRRRTPNVHRSGRRESARKVYPRKSKLVCSASALGIDLDCHETVTVTVDDLPGAFLSAVDGRCSQRHLLHLIVDLPSEALDFDRETERVAEVGDEGL